MTESSPALRRMTGMPLSLALSKCRGGHRSRSPSIGPGLHVYGHRRLDTQRTPSSSEAAQDKQNDAVLSIRVGDGRYAPPDGIEV